MAKRTADDAGLDNDGASAEKKAKIADVLPSTVPEAKADCEPVVLVCCGQESVKVKLEGLKFLSRHPAFSADARDPIADGFRWDIDEKQFPYIDNQCLDMFSKAIDNPFDDWIPPGWCISTLLAFFILCEIFEINRQFSARVLKPLSTKTFEEAHNPDDVKLISIIAARLENADRKKANPKLQAYAITVACLAINYKTRKACWAPKGPRRPEELSERVHWDMTRSISFVRRRTADSENWNPHLDKIVEMLVKNS
jgi:hypothetical protein